MWFEGSRKSLLAIGTAVLLAIGLTGSAAGADPQTETVTTSSGGDDLALIEEQRMAQLERLVVAGRALGTYRRDGGELVVVVPSSGTSTFRASDARALGLDVRIETADIELEDIEEIREIVLARAWHPDADDHQAGVAFVPEIGKVRLYSNAPEYVYAYFEDQFPGKTVFEHTTITVASRLNDVEAHWGGACITVHGFTPPPCTYPPSNNEPWCTSGFSVITTDTAKHRMVTAGHCFQEGTKVRSPSGTTFGSVKRNLWWGNAGYHGDMALIGEGTNDIKMGPSIYIGGSTGTQANVYSVGPPYPDTGYCYSGARTYENCGHERTSDNFAICGADPNNPYACHYSLQEFRNPLGQGSCGGDSGGPFYLKSTGPDPDAIYIRGMVVLQEGEPCYDNTRVWIETWPKIDSLLNVDIKTI